MSDPVGPEQHGIEPAPLPVLREPADGVPTVVETAAGLADAVAALASGTGPVAIDTERAQSFRYSAKAYLIQLRRAGSGTFIIDPVPFEGGGLVTLHRVLAPVEWILHAASQDLPCLIEAGLVPTELFDTEQAGRLLNLPRVGLGAMIEHYFGLRLLKEHSAADWSRRPIPEPWLVYAALDVELLIELREKMAAELVASGKDEWARQEFAHRIEAALSPREPHGDRWRRTSGMHEVRTPVGLAVVRELWNARDEIARREDRAPGQILLDRAISELASSITREDPQIPGRDHLRRIDGFKRRQARRFEENWLQALDRVSQMPRHSLPPMKAPMEGPPPPRTWQTRDPEAFRRWTIVRPAVIEHAETADLPVENLISPDALRRLLWEPPALTTEQAVDARLAALGVRPWQRAQLSGPIARLLAELQ